MQRQYLDEHCNKRGDAEDRQPVFYVVNCVVENCIIDGKTEWYKMLSKNKLQQLM